MHTLDSWTLGQRYKINFLFCAFVIPQILVKHLGTIRY